MTNRKNRIDYITKTLSLRGLINIKELSDKLNVSEMTIRRDLEILAKENIAQIIHGGAVLKKNISTESEQDSYLISKAESQMILLLSIMALLLNIFRNICLRTFPSRLFVLHLTFFMVFIKITIIRS